MRYASFFLFRTHMSFNINAESNMDKAWMEIKVPAANNLKILYT